MPQHVAFFFSVLLICAGHAAHAARPFVTDDARVVDEGGCQIEIFVKRQRKLDEHEFWFLPACNPLGRFELTAGRSWTDGSGYAQTVGALRVSPFQTAHTSNPYLNGIGSFSFADDRVVVHANLGAINDRQAGTIRATWGLGAEIAFHPQL